MAATLDEKLQKVLTHLKEQGHKVVEVPGKVGTYRCPRCGRYMTWVDGKATGAMTNGKCAGGIREG